MLSISNISSAADAADYYAADDYYAESGEPPGRWLGRGAALLGVTGQVARDDFVAVLEGRDPSSGAALVAGAGRDSHRPGWDCTFSAPKTVSCAWAAADDADRAAIKSAHDQAVSRAVELLETEAATARRGHGGVEHERTAGLIVAAYSHCTSRAQDPQLHSHAVVANLAPRTDGSWGGIESRSLYQWKMAAGAAYRAELAAGLAALGYGIAVTEDSNTFEIFGVPDELVERWSSRSAEIDAAARAHGITTAAGRETAALATREAKAAIDRPALLARWQAEAAKYDFSAEQVAELRYAQIGQQTGQELSDGQILENLTEQRSVFRRSDVFRAAAVAEQIRGGGIAAASERAEQLIASTEVVRLYGGTDDRPTYTTREMLQIEAGILDNARLRNAERLHVCDTSAITAAGARRTLSDEQARALSYLTRDSGGVATVVGDAGTGKSHLMGAAREAWAVSGYRVRGCALAGKAAAGLQAGAAINSQTLHSLLADLERGRVRLGHRDVIVLDEAGTVGSRQMADLFQRAEASGAKLVLVGDHKQLQPVAAGAAFRHVAGATGAARLADIRRQADSADREIVRQFAAGNAADALAALEKRGRYHVAPTADAALARVVAGWAADWDADRPGETLLIAGTRLDAARLNALAREHRAASDGLGLDQAVTVGDRQLVLAEGDRILFNRNSTIYDVKNGHFGTVSAIAVRNDGTALLDIDRDEAAAVTVDTAEYPHLSLGYAITAHRAQGVTVDRAHILASDAMSDREWAYVTASRARHETHLYADASVAADLKQSMATSHQAETTLDYAADNSAAVDDD